MAGIAGHVVGRGDPVAYLVLRDPLADRRYGPRDLMSQDRGRLMDPVPLQDVRAADAAGVDLHQDFSVPNLRPRPFFHADVPVVVIDGNAHESILHLNTKPAPGVTLSRRRHRSRP